MSHLVKGDLDLLLADGVVAAGVVVGGVLLAGDELLGVEHLSVDASPDLVNDGGLQVHEHGPGHVLASPCLGEEGGEGVIRDVRVLLQWRLLLLI